MYKVQLIKKSKYGSAGKYVEVMDKASYMNLYKAGAIDDDHNLVKEKKAKKVEKTEKIETEKKDNKIDNNLKNK